jgi:hypothetical protein
MALCCNPTLSMPESFRVVLVYAWVLSCWSMPESFGVGRWMVQGRGARRCKARSETTTAAQRGTRDKYLFLPATPASSGTPVSGCGCGASDRRRRQLLPRLDSSGYTLLLRVSGSGVRGQGLRLRARGQPETRNLELRNPNR